jgi:hypothetical protein
MHQLLMASLLVLAGQNPHPATAAAAQHAGKTAAHAASIEGTWSLVFGEREGHALKVSNVTIHNNVLSFTMDGKQHDWRLAFGPRQSLSAWHEGERTHTTGTAGAKGTTASRAVEAGAHHGVYILSDEYLCLSIQRATPAAREGAAHAKAATGKTASASGAATAARMGAMAGPHQNRFFVMILHRPAAATRGHVSR